MENGIQILRGQKGFSRKIARSSATAWEAEIRRGVVDTSLDLSLHPFEAERIHRIEDDKAAGETLGHGCEKLLYALFLEIVEKAARHEHNAARRVEVYFSEP